MLDIGWTELMMIAVVAVVVIGPKDLPKAMADLAGWVRKLRGLATDFRGQVNDMVKGTELEEVAKAAKGFNRYNVTRQLNNTIDPQGQMKKALDETRQAVNARVDAAAPAVPNIASSSGMASSSGIVEAEAAPAASPGSGAALADNPAAVRAMSGETTAETAAPAAAPKLKPKPKPSRPKAAAKPSATVKPPVARKSSTTTKSSAATARSAATAGSPAAKPNGTAEAAGRAEATPVAKSMRPRRKVAPGEPGGDLPPSD